MSEPLRVCCAVLMRQGKILVTQRSDNLTWEFPGGKVLPDESLEEALSREIQEELELMVDPRHWSPCGVLTTETIELNAFFAQVQSSILIPRVHRAFAWLNPSQIASLNLCSNDQTLLCEILTHL